MSTEDQAGRADQAAPMTPRGAARRRMAKAGLGAAGVLWTAQSHASMAPLVCSSPSAALSTGLQSNYGNKPTNCAGKSPGYWKNHSGWPVPSNTQFNAVFPCSFKNDSTYGSSTLLDIVRGRDFDRFNLGMHLVVTYLNVRSGRIGFLAERTLVQMWNELQSAGVYQPAKGVFWSAEQTKRYLESTHD